MVGRRDALSQENRNWSFRSSFSISILTICTILQFFYMRLPGTVRLR